MDKSKPVKGRGTQSFSSNRFEENRKVLMPELGEYQLDDKTKYIEVFPKSLINKVESPDVPYDFSINPYQGCEHGCIYCYARNSHEYWGYDPGLEFESRILVKKEAPQLLRKELRSKNWKASPIMLSGNTDCYQPAERKFGITRELLQVFAEKKHPVSLITKNKLILRDIDLIRELSEQKLSSVALSINYSDDQVRRKVEPRASSVESRFEALRSLAEAGVYVTVLIAPVIPGINDDQIPEIVERAADLGASNVGMMMVRLNGAIGMLFESWLAQHYPDRADKVMNRIRSLHGGQLNDSRFGTRMKGEGQWSNILYQQFHLMRRKHFGEIKSFEFDLQLFNPQLSLF